MVYRIYSADSGASWTADQLQSFVYFEQYGTQYAPAPPRETYLSGYLPRYQKRQIVGYHSASGDLRSIEVNASGHVLTDIEVDVSSGLYVITQSGINVTIQSGAQIILPVEVENGGLLADVDRAVIVGLGYAYHPNWATWHRINFNYTVASGAVYVSPASGSYTASGLGVLVQSGAGVQVQSGVGVLVQSGYGVLASGQQTALSGHGGQYPFNIEIDNSEIVFSGAYETVISLLYAKNTEDLTWERLTTDGAGRLIIASGVGVLTQTPQSIYINAPSNPQVIGATSGGDILTSGRITSITVKALSTNSGDLYVGGHIAGHRPYSGVGYPLAPGNNVTINIQEIGYVRIFAEVSGDLVAYLGA